MNTQKSYNKVYFNFMGLKIGSFKRTYHNKPLFFVDFMCWNIYES